MSTPSITTDNLVTTPTPSLTTDELLAKLHALARTDHTTAWGADLEDTCETIWIMLEQESFSDLSHRVVLDAIVELLTDQDAFNIAKLVIPELRSVRAPPLTNKHKQYILDHTLHQKVSCATYSDAPLYRSEKEILADAEIYRARVAFENVHPMTTTERERFRHWWASNPLAKKELEKPSVRS